MNDKNFYSVFLSELKSKWYIILLIAAVLGLGLALEKRATLNSTVTVSTSAHAQQMVKVVSLEDNRPLDMIAGANLFTNSSLERYNFLIESQKTFDYSKFNANFPLWDGEKQFVWLEQRLWTSTFYPNLFLFGFSVKEEDVKDLEYTNANVEAFLSEYIAFCDKKLQTAGIGRLVVVDKGVLPAEGEKLSRRSVVIKYGIIGIILGAIVGLLVIAGLSMRRVSHD